LKLAREKPLRICPDPVCRRSGVCRAQRGAPCRKLFFKDMDEWRDALAERLEQLFLEWGGDPAALTREPPEPPPEYVAELRACLMEREAEGFRARIESDTQPGQPT
jgi:hypothetical protein